MQTTLRKISEHAPCQDGLRKLLRKLGKKKADDEPVSIVQILDSNGLDDALWCLRAVEGHDREIRHYIVWLARRVQHLMNDERSIAALNVAEKFADGLVTQEELTAASAAAGDAARASKWYSACSFARTAARAATLASASHAAYTANAVVSAAGIFMRVEQEEKLRELCAWCAQNPVGYDLAAELLKLKEQGK